MALAPIAAATPGDITTVAGSGVGGLRGDGGAATLAQLNAPTGVAPLADGGFLVADFNNNRIRRVSAGGVITTVAGTGVPGGAGDGGAATSAQLTAPLAVAPLADGGFLIADSGSNRIRKVSAAGVITTVAGAGAAGASGDGFAATAAALNGPTDARPTADGGFLVADYKNNRIRRVSAAGVITTVAGTGAAGSSGDGGAAVAAKLRAPIAVAPTADGGFLIADSGNNRIRAVSSAGLITTVAGTGVAGFSGDGFSATAARLNAPLGVQAMPGGGFLVADMSNNRVRLVSPGGTITTFAGTGAAAFGGDGGAATAASLKAPVGLAVAATGAILIADSGNNRIRSIEGAPAPGPITPVSPLPGDLTPALPHAPDPAVVQLSPVTTTATGGVRVTSSGVVPLAIGCRADAGTTCRGTLTLAVRVRPARASAARLRTLTIARAKFAVAPGRKATLKIRLTRRGRHLLDKKGKLKVTAKISRRGGPNLGEKSQTSRLTLKSSRSRRVKKAAVTGGIR